MRVIAGIYRSRILKSLKGLALRPTSDRLRETLLNVLAPNLPGSRFVDLFAGTGAIGIEALSRGAAEVVFIENHAPAAILNRRVSIPERPCLPSMLFAGWQCWLPESNSPPPDSTTFFSIRPTLLPKSTPAC